MFPTTAIKVRGKELNNYMPYLELKHYKQRLIESGEVDIGKPIVPIEFTRTTINDGNVVTTKHEVSGRKFDLLSIREEHLLRMASLKLLRGVDIDSMSARDIDVFLCDHGIPVLDSEDAREKYATLTKTRNLTMWHDHSDIAGSSHYLFMVWFLFDDVVYYTDDEFKNRHDLDYVVNVQATVEAPYVYLLARSGSSVKDQLMYIPTRLEDVTALNNHLSVQGFEYQDNLRFFSGDTPARQLEAGQQCGVVEFNSRGPFDSLQQRLDLLHVTDTWKEKSKDGKFAVFEAFKTQDILNELIRRGVTMDYSEKSDELKQLFVHTFKGIRRPPALWCTGADIDLPELEICQNEPLHDLKNVVNRVCDELPHCFKDKELKEELLSTLNDLKVTNREMKGTDCRLNLVKIAHFLSTKQSESEARKPYVLVLALVELQKIAYAPDSERSPRSILRAYNQSFVFAMAYIELFGEPKSAQHRSIFGMPFHCLSVHLPECLRLVSGRSIVAEHAERHFNKIRQITMRSSNRQAESLITNAIYRIAMERKRSVCYQDSFTLQEGKVCQAIEKSAISKVSNDLYLGRNTILTNRFLESNQTASLAHFKRIADFLEVGHGKWYRTYSSAIEFLDGFEEQDSHMAGPCKTHYRSHSLKDINLMLDKSWKDCLTQRSLLNIPLLNSLGKDFNKKVTKEKGDSRTAFAPRASIGLAVKGRMNDLASKPSISSASVTPKRK